MSCFLLKYTGCPHSQWTSARTWYTTSQHSSSEEVRALLRSLVAWWWHRGCKGNEDIRHCQSVELQMCNLTTYMLHADAITLSQVNIDCSTPAHMQTWRLFGGGWSSKVHCSSCLNWGGMWDLKNRSTLVAKEAVSGAVAVYQRCHSICSCTLFSLQLLVPVEAIIYKADKQRWSQVKRKIPTDNNIMRRSQANDQRGLSSARTDQAQAIYLDWRYIKLHEHARSRAATFDFKQQHHIGGLWPGLATPLLYRDLRKLPRAITNARWSPRTLLLRQTSSVS